MRNDELTPAERDVVARLCGGQTQVEAAAERGTSVKTVRAQVDAAKRKLGARTGPQLGLLYGAALGGGGP